VPAKQQTQKPIRVALSNDYELALLGVAQMLAPYPDKIQIVDITTDPQLPHEPDIVLFDTFGRLPGNDVKLRKIVDQNSAKVVVYSWEDYPEEAAMRGGAVAYLHKGITAGELVSALEAIHQGIAVPPGKPSGGPSNVTWPGKDLGLSSREAEMLSYITRLNTLKSYIRNAYRKIDVRTRAQAVAWGYEHGFQSTDDTGF
jgi:NarL family two-component system response regulator LiaR